MPANNPKENTGSVKHGDQGRSASRQNRNAGAGESGQQNNIRKSRPQEPDMKSEMGRRNEEM